MNADLYAAWRNDGLERLSVIYEDGSFSIERIILDPCVLSRENPQIIMRNSPVLSSPYQEWKKRVIFIPPFAYS